MDAELFTVEFADDGTGVNKCTGEYKNEMITNKHCTGLYSYYEDSGMKINPQKSNVIYLNFHFKCKSKFGSQYLTKNVKVTPSKVYFI